jgi:hypothetical protein
MIDSNCVLKKMVSNVPCFTTIISQPYLAFRWLTASASGRIMLSSYKSVAAVCSPLGAVYDDGRDELLLVAPSGRRCLIARASGPRIQSFPASVRVQSVSNHLQGDVEMLIY